MDEQELMTEADVHAFGIEIVFKQLETDGWAIDSADMHADKRSEPQIVARKNGELAFFVVRTAVYPNRGRFEEGQKLFERLVRHAQAHAASCYFASVGIANAEGTTEDQMAMAIRGVGYNIQFDGLIKMELLPGEGTLIVNE